MDGVDKKKSPTGKQSDPKKQVDAKTGKQSSTIGQSPMDAAQRDAYLESWSWNKSTAALFRDMQSGANKSCVASTTTTKPVYTSPLNQVPHTEKWSPDCKFESISAECSHSKVDKADIGLTYTQKTNRNRWPVNSHFSKNAIDQWRASIVNTTLEVISKDGDKIALKMEGLKSLCADHDDGIVVKDAYLSKLVTKNIFATGSFTAATPLVESSWYTPSVSKLQYFFPTSAPYREYDVTAECCWTKAHITVRSYIHIWWTASFSVGFTDKWKIGFGASDQYGTTKVGGKGKHSGSLICEFGSKTYSILEIESERKALESTLTIFQVISTYVKPVQDLLTKGPALKLELIYPTLSFEGGWGLREHPEKPTTYVAFDVQIGLCPLIGGKLTINALRLLASRVPGLNWLLDELEEGVGGDDVSVKFEAFAGLKMKGTISIFIKASGDTEYLSNTKIVPECGEAKLDLSLEAYIKGEVHFWCVKGQAGAGAGGSAAWKMKVRQKPNSKTVEYQAKFIREDFKVFAYAYADGSIDYSNEDKGRSITSGAPEKPEEEDPAEYVLVEGNADTAEWETFSVF